MQSNTKLNPVLPWVYKQKHTQTNFLCFPIYKTKLIYFTNHINLIRTIIPLSCPFYKRKNWGSKWLDNLTTVLQAGKWSVQTQNPRLEIQVPLFLLLLNKLLHNETGLCKTEVNSETHTVKCKRCAPGGGPPGPQPAASLTLAGPSAACVRPVGSAVIAGKPRSDTPGE